jgi:hypothetical protein
LHETIFILWADQSEAELLRAASGVDPLRLYPADGRRAIRLLVFVELKDEEVKKLEQAIEKPGITVNVIPIGVL